MRLRSLITRCALVVAAVCPLGWAQTSRPTGFRTFIEDKLLVRSPVVVRAHFDRDDDLPTFQVTAYAVVATLRGKVARRVLVVGGGDAARAFRDQDKILFLAPGSSGALYSLIDVIDLVEPGADDTDAAVRGWLRVSDEKDPDKKRLAARKQMFDGLESAGTFARRAAVYEFERLLDLAPGTITGGDLPALRRADKGLAGGDRDRFRNTLSRFESSLLKDYAGTEKDIPAGEDRDYFLRGLGLLKTQADLPIRLDIVDTLAFRYGTRTWRFLVAALADPMPEVRKRALVHLGGMMCHDPVPLLIGRLDTPGVLDATDLVACLGEIADESATLPLARMLDRSDALWEAGVRALARIGVTSPMPRPLLDRIADALRGQPAMAERLKLLDDLRSPRFAEEERARRKTVRARYHGS